ncbi:hyalin-like [Patiria miniata]|uniref:HYR domain-containing protein n=1 Tax=Patiria miniata TaxID=46514 RepID=A0A914ASX2_PATMI|nr:hyalin-like [Patiria miniata]
MEVHLSKVHRFTGLLLKDLQSPMPMASMMLFILYAACVIAQMSTTFTNADVATSDGTAVNGTDYTTVSTTLDFKPANNRVALNVPVLDNGIENADSDIHCFTLTLTNPNPSGILGATSQVCIIDNDNFFGGTCPPPEAVIESNGQAVIEVNVTSASDTAVITWTDPTPAGVQRVYTCFPIRPSDHGCNNGDSFPISYTFTSDGYDRRILVTYTVYTTVSLTMQHNCDFYLRVLDPFPPEITCPRDLRVIAMKGDLNRTVDWIEPVGTDNSDVTTNSYSPPLVLNIGSHEFTYTAVDSSGNEASCSFNVIITAFDTSPPVFSDCPSSVPSVPTDPGSNTASAFDFGVTVSDSGSGVESSVLTTNEPFALGDNFVSLFAVDFAGNVAYCNFTVIVYDMEPPNITCAQNLTFSTSPGLPTAYVTYIEPDATDNVGVMNLNCFNVDSSGQALGVGTYIVHCVATDSSDERLTGVCSFSITVEDNESPNITCPANETVPTDGAAPVATFTLPLLDSVVDNTGNFSVSIDVAGAQHDIGGSVRLSLSTGVHLLQYTATDSYTNSEVCDMFVTVIDDEDPVITCPAAFTVGTDAGLATANVTWELATVMDNSMLPITPVDDPVSGSILPLGVTTVQFNATDASGNSATCTFVVAVEGASHGFF